MVAFETIINALDVTPETTPYVDALRRIVSRLDQQMENYQFLVEELYELKAKHGEGENADLHIMPGLLPTHPRQRRWPVCATYVGSTQQRLVRLPRSAADRRPATP